MKYLILFLADNLLSFERSPLDLVKLFKDALVDNFLLIFKLIFRGDM